MWVELAQSGNRGFECLMRDVPESLWGMGLEANRTMQDASKGVRWCSPHGDVGTAQETGTDSIAICAGRTSITTRS